MIRFSFARPFLGLLAFALSVLAPLSAAPHPAPTSAWAKLPPHPRLFALIRARAEAVLKLPPVKITARSRGKLAGTILEPAREIQRRVLLLAATARLTGDSRFRAGRVRQRQTIWSAR